jgi:hypothetical protein
MKRVILWALVLGLCLGWISLGFAQTDEAKKALLKGLELKARQTLKSQEWTIYLVPLELSKKEKPTVETDILTFTDMKVKSQNLSAKGYGESNYSLRVQEDGTATWETMQVNENEDLVFLRGDLKGNQMTGIISMQPKKGTRRDYSFSTTMPTITPPTATEEASKAKRR